MLMKLVHLAKVANSVIREQFKKRSTEWPTVRKHYLVNQPKCEACGGTSFLQVHHIIPFHENPELELHSDNLITLCMSVNMMCHLRIGHGGSFKFFSRSVAEDSKQVLEHPEMFLEVSARAEESRVPNDPND